MLTINYEKGGDRRVYVLNEDQINGVKLSTNPPEYDWMVPGAVCLEILTTGSGDYCLGDISPENAARIMAQVEEIMRERA